MSIAFNEDFTFTDIEFFREKCHEYLQRIYTRAYKVDTAQSWKDEYIKGQNDFRQLEKEMPTEETELKAFEAKLWPTYQNMEDALRNLQWTPRMDHRVEEIQSRRDFLVKIGKPNVEPGPPVRFWRPPAAQIGDIHALLRELRNM
jgi:hypothetical protein